MKIDKKDLINGLFELLAAPFIGFSIWKLIGDKSVAGISYVHLLFFFGWGLWNLYYYPSLKQILSFIGGIAVTVTNGIYVALIIYYTYFY